MENYGDKTMDLKKEMQFRQELRTAWQLVEQYKRAAELCAAERDAAQAKLGLAMTNEVFARAEMLGGGNASRGVERAVNALFEQQGMIDESAVDQ